MRIVYLTSRAAATLAAAALYASVPARAAPDDATCLVTCAASAECRLAGDTTALTSKSFQKLQRCQLLTVEGGTVLLRYRHDRKWFQPPPLGAGKRFAEVFATFPADRPCSVPDSECLQQRMSDKSVARAGNGVDSQVGAPGGVNAPCTKGLPCGTVLPPPSTWSFRLVDATFNGQWRVRVARGAPPAGVPAQFEVPVAAGAVQLDGAKVSPGGVYAYQLLDAAGSEVANGEFAVMGATDTNRLQRLAQRRVDGAGMSEQAAWIDTLLASELDWDAEQLLQLPR